MSEQPIESDNIYALSDDELLSLGEVQQEVVAEPEVVTAPESTPEVPIEEVTPEVDEQTPTPSDAEEPIADEIDYKGFYESVTKPFVANGKEVQVNNPDDMIRLMQQGAGFHKKMASLKPMQRYNKLLEDNGLLDETQLGYLIDLHQKKPEAIARLVKDSGIDLYDFDLGKGDSYSPQVNVSTDQELELNTVLTDLQQNSPSYAKTVNVLGNLWDEPSRKIVAEHPQLIQIIDAQIQDGTYDQVMQYVDYERMMGRLNNVSDLEAYRQIGDQLVQSGRVQKPQADMKTQPVPVPVIPLSTQVSPTPSTVDQRRRAVASPKTNNVDTAVQVDTMQMSDEELLKQFNY